MLSIIIMLQYYRTQPNKCNRYILPSTAKRGAVCPQLAFISYLKSTFISPSEELCRLVDALTSQSWRARWVLRDAVVHWQYTIDASFRQSTVNRNWRHKKLKNFLRFL